MPTSEIVERLHVTDIDCTGMSFEQATKVAELLTEIERLRAVLQQLVTDYQDVPDPTDADGQAVFEEARRALEQKP